MVYETLSNRNVSEGFHVIFIYLNDVTGGLFMNTFLFCAWFIIAWGIYKQQKADIYNGDLPSAIAVSSFIIMILTIIFRLIPNLISDYTFGVVIAVFLASLVWLFMSRDE